MERKLLAMAVLAGLSGVAVANDTNVTLYGIVDGGVSYTNKAAQSGGGTGSLLGYETNGESPSIFGFKGTEDLGGGLKANFDLEGHFLTSTGIGEQWGGLFGRQANVGLSSSAGKLSLGTMYSPAILAYAATDPRGLKESYSGLMTWAFSTYGLFAGSAPLVPGTTPSSNSVLDIFLKNAISGGTSFGPVDVTLAYAFGGVAGSTQANRVISLGAVYTGPVTISLAYQSENGDPTTALPNATGMANEKVSIGGAYTMDAFTFKLNYLDNKGKNPSTGNEVSHYKIIGAGVDYKVSDVDSVTLAYYNGKNSDGTDDKANSLILSNDYSLSKRTTFYGLIATVKSGTGVSFGSSAYNGDNFNAPPVSNTNSMAFELGLKHTF